MRRRWVRRVWYAALLSLAGFAGVVVWARWAHPPVTDETAFCEQLGRTVAAWASKSGLDPRPARFKQAVKQDEFYKWLYLERAYWVPPRRRLATLKTQLGQIASAHGLKLKRERARRGGYAAVLVDVDGRETMRLSLRPQVFVALVIDDLGYSMNLARRVAALPCKLTFAIIPLTPRARAVASLARVNGKEVFIHMPMQPAYLLPDVPEYAIVIRPELSVEEVRERIQRAHRNLPHAVGLNTHEGSLATEDRTVMVYVMAEVKKRGLVFLDSATTAETVAWKVAREAGVKWGRRDVFLDSEPDRAFVDAAFTKLIALARKRGQAIAIGHPLASTLDVLERRIPEAQRQGVEFVFASSLCAGRAASAALH